MKEDGEQPKNRGSTEPINCHLVAETDYLGVRKGTNWE